MISEATARRLSSRLAAEQRAQRLPSVVAAAVRGTERVWVDGRGLDAPEPGDVQYRIGSITKTLIAVCVLRLRDEGRLDLGDPVTRHVPDAPVATATIAQLLSHSAGLQAETAGPWWERVPGGNWDELIDQLGSEALRHPAGRRFHYSNVGFAVAAEMVSRLRGDHWFDVVERELLVPLEMRRTTQRPAPPAAPGLAVHPWADVALPEPEHDAGAMAPAGQIWASAQDLARWAMFLGGDTGDVLAADTLAEMREPLAMDDRPGAPWTLAFGLGLQLWNVAGRRFVGHGGSMPGFVAGVRVDVETRDGLVAMTNSTSGFSSTLMPDLHAVLDEEPAETAPWEPQSVAPAVVALCGVWYWGPTPFVLRALDDGLLDLSSIEEGRGSRFRPLAEGTWVGLDAYYAGERLRVVRRPDGSVSHLDIATFIFTRSPYDPDADIPGGVDPGGWR